MLNLLEHSGSFKNNDVISIRTHDHKDHVKTMLTTQPPRFKKLRRFFFSYVCPKSTQSESSMQAWYLSVDDDDEGDDDEDPMEHIHVDEKFSYLEHVIRFMAVLHSIISLFMLIAYYHLKG